MKKEVCKNCLRYITYYRKFSADYGRLTHGFCTKHNKPQLQSKTCVDYNSNEQKEKKRQKTLLYSLEQALKSINEIAQILKEKQEDTNDE